MNKTRLTAIALVVLLIGGLVVALLGGNRAPQEDVAHLPRSMAAIGDSITRAAALDTSSPGDSPERAWTTGDRPYSHRGRLLAAGAVLEPSGVHNLAESGARMEDAPAQARAAVEAGAEYVTFLMGANDVCAREAPSAAEFRGHFFASLNILMGRLPEVHLFVASIPNIDHLRTLFGDDPRVTQLWEAAEICPPILSPRTTEDERAEAIERLHAFNRVLEEGCGATTRCTYDGGAVFAYRFERADISALDHFHPSARGQEVLAEITWRAIPWSR